ncbi:vWA domain-containing protein [Cellvibrio sp.]|uniref:vWA domain-containing protein n=1 Tax=Cellvibrio sp. TaxID=1965322 RepID=UPI0039647ABD
MSLLQEQLFLIQSQFHWLRPYWLFALVPAILLMIFLWRQKHHAYQWQQLVAPELLPYLLDGKTVQTKKSLLWFLLLAWVLGAIALAGPSWIKRPSPVEKNQNALVILLDLSYSMISEDIKPSRIARARLKIADILRERKDGQTALVAYAGEAHTVTPLSDDKSTIVSLLSSMHPNIMPLQGSNTEAAVERGIQLLHDAGATQGDLLLVTDGVVPEAFNKIRSLLANKKIHLDILGVGTTQAAPIPNSNGGFLQDNSGKIITTQLNSAELTQLAQSLNSRYHELVNSNADIEYLKPREYKDSDNAPKVQRDFDQWVDNGYWLVFLLLPIALFCFRRGVLLSFLLIPLLGFSPSKSYALAWDDLWLTKNQQAQRELKNGDAKTAAEKFESPEWKASALYRAGDYAAAANSFASIDTANGHYNRGNALAKAGKLQDALKAYDEALKRDSNMADAKKNRELVEKLLKHQQSKNEQYEKNQENNDQKNDDKENNSDQKDKKDGQQESQNKDNQHSENQQNKNQAEQNSSSGSNGDSQQNSQSSSSAAAQPKNADQQKSQNASSSAAAQSGQSGQSGQSSSAAAQQHAASQASSGNSSSQTGQMLNNLTDEQKQALEQWLRRVPDDPGGLLRNKFKYQYDQNRLRERNGESNSPSNNADQRL